MLKIFIKRELSIPVKLRETSLIILLLVILLGNNATAQEYELVWSDEFDETTLDLSKWEAQIGNGINGWGNNELEYYRAENASIDSGYLIITAKKENYGGKQYTSSRIRTINKGDWKYGKFEFRAKMPYGKGIWPAIWMMPTDNVYGGWAASGEIDIMEFLGHQTDRVYGTLHYGGAWPNNRQSGDSYSLLNSNFNDDFHTFTLVWEEGKIQWFVDDVLYQTQTSWNTAGAPFPAPFDQRFHLIINLAVGGNWPGYPDSTTMFPQKFIIDYARVYQKATTGIDEEPKEHSTDFALSQNYPNPFNSRTIIRYQLNKTERVKLSIFDMQGRLVARLVNKDQCAGSYSVPFDATGLSSGVYMYRLNIGDQFISRKLLYIK